MPPPLLLRSVFKAFPDEYSLRLSGLSVWINGRYRGRGILDYVFGHTSKQNMFESLLAMSPHDDKVDLLGFYVLEDLFCGNAAPESSFHFGIILQIFVLKFLQPSLGGRKDFILQLPQ